MKASKKTTLAILIDSFRHDMLGPNTPFLSRMAEQGSTGILEPPLSFCLHPTWFAGLSPESSGKFLHYVYSPATAPYRRLRLVSYLERDRFLRIPGGFARHHLLSGSTYGHAQFIPPSIFKYFDVSEKVPPWDRQYVPRATTLFDILKEEGLKWLFIGSPGSDQRAFAVLDNFQRSFSSESSFVWLHFAEPDWLCHAYGPESTQVKKKLVEIDKAIEKICGIMNRVQSELNIFVFGDHGHVAVNRAVNVEAPLKQSSFKITDDYVSFLDSTIARFWCKNENVRNRIVGILSGIGGGKILSEDDLRRYSLNMQESERGQLIWVAEEGTIILPNFWQGQSIVKGMHGYLPGVHDNCSRFVASGPNVRTSSKFQKWKLADIFPTLLDFMALRPPSTNEGTSILSKS